MTLSRTPETAMRRGPRLARMATLAAALACAALPLRADQIDSAVFDLQIRGLRVGTLSLSGAVQGASYSVAGKLSSAGIIGALRKVSYDAKSAGTVKGVTFTPSRYEEKADTGRRESEAVMDYVAGVPQLKVYNPPRKSKSWDIDPATQGGTLDPLTAAYAVLRDVPAEGACNAKFILFDGKRRSQVTLSNPQAAEGGISCTGEYRRLAGFSRDDMAEKVSFPFTLTYQNRADGTLRASQVTMDTLYGKGVLKRR